MKHIIQFDVLRIIAAFAVVLEHVSAQGFYDSFPSIEWETRNFFDSSARWGVPIFVMISGALFLDSQRNVNIKNLYSKNITRIILIFFFWSIIYGFYDNKGGNLVFLLGRMIYGPRHFWFLKMLIGLYISVPLLRVIVANRKLEKYFVFLSLVTAYFIPMLFPLIGLIDNDIRDIAVKNIKEFNLNIALGYVGYFVLGHYLYHTVVKNKTRILLGVLGITSIIVVCVLTHYISNFTGAPNKFLYHNVNMFTLFEAIAVFVLIKDVQIDPRHHPILKIVSKLTLGIYIVHLLVIRILLDLWNIDSTYLNPVYFIPIFAIFVFVISLMFTILLTKIPLVRIFIR